MAQDIIGNMFGVDPNQLRMRQLNNAYQQNMMMAQLDPFERANAQIANAVSGATMLGAQAMGLKTREEQVAENRQQIAMMIKDESPDSYLAAAQKAQELGDTQAATMLVQKANEAKVTKSKLDHEAALTAKANRPTEILDILVGTTNKGTPVYFDKAGALQYTMEGNKKIPFSGKLDKYGNSDGSGSSGSVKPVKVVDTNPSSPYFRKAILVDVNNKNSFLGLAADADQQILSESAAAKAGGVFEAKAQYSLPDIENAADSMKANASALVTHPGFKTAVGVISAVGLKNVPGSDAKDFDVAKKQLVGQQFKIAFETLKGGGSITNIEGEKATDALSRINSATSKKSFIQAVNDFNIEIEKLRVIARQRATKKDYQTPKESNTPTDFAAAAKAEIERRKKQGN